MEIWLMIISICLLIWAGLMSAFFWCYKRQVQYLQKTLDFIEKEDTNIILTARIRFADLNRLGISVNRVLNKHRKLEIELQKTNRNFRETITSISHDIRTPLTSASGYLQMLNASEFPEHKKKEYHRLIQKRVLSVQNMLDQLFEYARIESGEIELNRETIQMDNLLRDTLSLFYHNFVEKQQEPEIFIVPESCMVTGDRDALKRVLENILRNALVHGTGNYRISLTKEKHKVKLEVSNQTDSIEAADIERIFERFYTTDKSRTKKTTGLGLSIAQNFVTQMGGEIKAELNEKQFSIILVFPAV